MMRDRFSTRKGSAGFTLLETLLTIGLLGLLLAGMYQILNGWTQRAIDREAAADMMRVRTAAHGYVLANFDTFKTSPVGQFIEIPINDMKPDNYLPNGFQPINAFRQVIRVFRRNLQVTKLDTNGAPVLDDNGNPVMITTIEVVVASDNPTGDTLRAGNQRLIDAAQAGGPAMGVISDIVMPGGSFSGLVTSLVGQWYIQRADLAAAGYLATPDVRGGYLATYDLVSSEATDANDHWLYRVSIVDRPNLNRMATNLNMNGNKLQNVGTVVADKYTVTGNAAFRGITQGAASETAQGMTIEQALRVDSTGESRINMKSNNGTCSFSPGGGGNRVLNGNGCSISGGEMQTIAEDRVDPSTHAVLANAGDAAMGVQSLTADGNVITDITRVTHTTDTAGISTFETIDGTTMNASTTVLAPVTNLSGNLVQTSQYQTGEMDITNGATIGNQVVSARISPGLAHTYTTQQMSVGNAVELTGNLVAATGTASDTLYLDNATGGYYDTVLGRNVVCTPYNGRTYCEPTGTTYWNGGQIYDQCNITGSGYQCNYYRNTIYGWQYYGMCNFTRSVGSSGQAYHDRSCT